MSNCPKCGTFLEEENLKFCPNCGVPLPAEQDDAGTSASAQAQPAETPAFDPGEQMKKGMAYSAPLGLDKKTFLKNYSLGRKECVAAAVLGYVTSGATAILSFVGFRNFSLYSLIDVAIVLTLCLLVHLLRSRIASILLLVYALASMVSMFVNSGVYGGWLVLAAGISAVVGSFQCVKEWKTYQARTQSPAQSAVPTL